MRPERTSECTCGLKLLSCMVRRVQAVSFRRQRTTHDLPFSSADIDQPRDCCALRFCTGSHSRRRHAAIAIDLDDQRPQHRYTDATLASHTGHRKRRTHPTRRAWRVAGCIAGIPAGHARLQGVSGCAGAAQLRHTWCCGQDQRPHRLRRNAALSVQSLQRSDRAAQRATGRQGVRLHSKCAATCLARWQHAGGTTLPLK